MNINIRKIGALLLLLFSIFTLAACQNITEEVTVESIQVEISTLKPNYNVDDFDLSTISIRVTFSDGKFQIIPITESMLTEEHLSLLSNVGEHQITITYQGKSTTINLNLQYDSLKTQLMTLYTLSTTSGSFSGTYEEWLETVRGPQGNPGREVTFQVSNGYIQWQYQGDQVWQNLINLEDLRGNQGIKGDSGVDGKEVTFRVGEGYIQWQYVGETTWTNLIEIATITGNNGTDGVDGLTPFIGDNGNWWIGENDTGVYAGNQATIPQTGEFQYAVNSDGQSYVFIKYVGNDRYVRIPDYYNGYPVVAIAKDAFNNNTILETVILPNKLKIIEKYSFYGASSLTSMTLPFVGQSRTATGTNAYFGYIFGNSSYTGSYSADGYYLPNSLTEVIITDATSIGSYAFFGASSLTSIVIPNSVTSIGDFAFRGASSLTSIVIPNSVTSIGSYAFFGASSLTSIVIPNSVTSIGDSAFRGASSLTSMTLPFVGQSRTATGTNAYFGYIFGKSSYTGSYSANGYYLPNSLTEVIITDATSIGSSAFYGASSLTSIVIPNSVTSIGDSAFRGASSLTSIVIPNSVTSIGSYAFLNTGLTIIYTSISSKPTNWNSNWVSNDVTVVWGYEQIVENDEYSMRYQQRVLLM